MGCSLCDKDEVTERQLCSRHARMIDSEQFGSFNHLSKPEKMYAALVEARELLVEFLNTPHYELERVYKNADRILDLIRRALVP